MTIKDLEPERKVKIGTDKGRGFFFIGKPKDADWDAIDDNLKNALWRTYVFAAGKVKDSPIEDVTTGAIKRMLKAEKGYTEYMPVADREIIRMERSIAEPDITIVIITGSGDGAYWLEDESRPVKHIEFESALNLVGAVYRELVGELEHYYTLMIKNNDHRNLIKASAQECEKAIRDNVYGAFNDPEGIIHQCRRNAAKGDMEMLMKINARMRDDN